jgi:hypothetical protein
MNVQTIQFALWILNIQTVFSTKSQNTPQPDDDQKFPENVVPVVPCSTHVMPWQQNFRLQKAHISQTTPVCCFPYSATLLLNKC